MKSKKEGWLLYNGKIYTQEQRFPLVSAIVIQGNRIVEIGKDSVTKKCATARFRKINLKGRTVLPAFCDCHTHFLGYVEALARLNLESARTLSRALDLIEKFVKNKKPSEWVLGYNWDANSWKDSPQPDKKALDQISALHPMAFSARDGHQLWVNSLALKMAGMDESTGEISGGQIGRYPNSNELSGILKDKARKPVEELIPEEIDSTLVKKAIQNLHRKGITAIHNMENGRSLSFFQELESQDKLSLRVWQTIAKTNLDDAIRAGLRTGFGSDKLRIGGVKLFADGALGSRTALMFEPYENEPDNLGLEMLSHKELADLVKKASHAGISAVIHAIGDQANYRALQAIKTSGNNDKLRHRIEHCQIVRPVDLDLFAEHKVIASFQPIHCPNDYGMAVRHWGNRNLNAYPIGSLWKRRVTICFGSDFPLYDFDPILGIYTAVNRTLPGSENPAWNPAQKISVAQAILAYTRNAAYASGREKELGTLAPGKLADLVILSEDIYRCKPDQIDQVEVTSTIFDGQVVWGELY